MSKNPVIVNITSEWSSVALSVEKITILKQDHTAVYFWQYLKQGDAIPSDSEGSEMLTSRLTLEFDEPVNIFMRVSANSRNGGIVRIDDHGANVITPVQFNIARNKYSGISNFSAYGKKTTIGADSGLLWSDGIFSVEPSASAIIEILSTNAGDSEAGTGIRTLAVIYIADDWTEKTEIVTMNGLTPVLMQNQVRFINCMFGITYGSLKYSAGNITARKTGTVINYNYIAINKKRCASSARMVPEGKRFLITAAIGSSVSATADTTTSIELVTSDFGGYEFLNPLILVPIASLGYENSAFGIVFPSPFMIKPRNIIAAEFITNKAATITCDIFGIIEDNF